MSDHTEGPTQGAGPPDMETLAKRYLDLWGKQVASMAADPKLAEAMSKTMAFMAEAAKGVPMPPGVGGSDDGGARPSGSSAPDPAPAASGDDLGRMAERIDALDRRVALLEAALGGILAQANKPGP
jgi:hypothetical protein